MIRRAIEAIRARRRQRIADARALAAYRDGIRELCAWVYEFPQTSMVLHNLSQFAGDASGTPLSNEALRDLLHHKRAVDQRERA